MCVHYICPQTQNLTNLHKECSIYGPQNGNWSHSFRERGAAYSRCAQADLFCWAALGFITWLSAVPVLGWRGADERTQDRKPFRLSCRPAGTALPVAGEYPDRLLEVGGCCPCRDSPASCKPSQELGASSTPRAAQPHLGCHGGCIFLRRYKPVLQAFARPIGEKSPAWHISGGLPRVKLFSFLSSLPQAE